MDHEVDEEEEEGHEHSVEEDSTHSHPRTHAKYSETHLEAEKALLKAEYKEYEYEILKCESSTGFGGMANNRNRDGTVCWGNRAPRELKLEVLLPTVDVSRNEEVASRHDELVKIPIDMCALPKDTVRNTLSIIFYKE